MRVLSFLICFLPATTYAADTEPAGESRTVVVVFEPNTEAMSQRLRQEIEALGFEVDLQPEGQANESLESLALAARAVAAIRVHPLQAGGVEMTVLDRATGKTVHRELPKVEAKDAAGDELVATRTVELFRASLMELNADHPQRGPVRASPPVQALTAADAEKGSRRFGTITLSAGPALALMPDWRPGVSLWLEGVFVSKSGIGFVAAVFSPLSVARLTAKEGFVDLSATTYRMGGVWEQGERSDLIAARLGAGLSLSTLSLRGSASDPYVGLHDDRIVWAPWLGASGRLRLSGHLALIAEISAELALPREAIRFAGRTVGDFARPAIMGAVGPELSWP